MITPDQLEELRAHGDVIWENERYGSVYVVERTGLANMLAEHVPVLHLGQVQAVSAITHALPHTSWLVANLQISRRVAAERIADRRDADLSERLRAWDETEPICFAHLTIGTEDVTAAEAAATIHRATEDLTHGSTAAICPRQCKKCVRRKAPHGRRSRPR